jgi:putative copper resistance protein D
VTDWAAIALRFGVLLDLMLLFGLAVYSLYATRPVPPGRQPAALGWLAVLGLVLSTAGFTLMTAEMAGVTIADLDRETLRFIILDTVPGTAFLARTAALIAAAALVFAGSRWPTGWFVAAAAGALATLAWTGHAAVTEGLPGTLHRLSDIIHLLAAAAWTGALAILLKALVSPIRNDEAVTDVRRALAGFAIAGSVLVALVIATGLLNGWMIVGVAGLTLLPETLYGQLLIAKLLLFAAMLALAAANRWQLTPRLAAAQAAGDTGLAVRALKISIALESGAAVLILVLVAWLGTLAPPSAM